MDSFSSSKKNKKKTMLSLFSLEDYVQNSHGSSSNSQKTSLASKNIFKNTPLSKKISEEINFELQKGCFNRIWKATRCQFSKILSLPH